MRSWRISPVLLWCKLLAFTRTIRNLDSLHYSVVFIIAS